MKKTYCNEKPWGLKGIEAMNCLDCPYFKFINGTRGQKGKCLLPVSFMSKNKDKKEKKMVQKIKKSGGDKTKTKNAPKLIRAFLFAGLQPVNIYTSFQSTPSIALATEGDTKQTLDTPTPGSVSRKKEIKMKALTQIVNQTGRHGPCAIPISGINWRPWNETTVAVDMSPDQVDIMMTAAACNAVDCQCGGYNTAQADWIRPKSGTYLVPIEWIDNPEILNAIIQRSRLDSQRIQHRLRSDIMLTVTEVIQKEPQKAIDAILKQIKSDLSMALYDGLLFDGNVYIVGPLLLHRGEGEFTATLPMILANKKRILSPKPEHKKKPLIQQIRILLFGKI